jgi:hypothetical protein
MPMARMRRMKADQLEEIAHRLSTDSQAIDSCFGFTVGTWLGTVESPDEATAIEKAAGEFKAPASRLMAIRR